MAFLTLVWLGLVWFVGLKDAEGWGRQQNLKVFLLIFFSPWPRLVRVVWLGPVRFLGLKDADVTLVCLSFYLQSLSGFCHCLSSRLGLIFSRLVLDKGLLPKP
jgi:hypothetical protein